MFQEDLSGELLRECQNGEANRNAINPIEGSIDTIFMSKDVEC